MGANPTPRQMAKGLLSGIAPPRPLFVPIVFSLGAKVENILLETFLTNPAKITSSLRQMRNPLGADGAACYFDPYLELEALGATLQRPSDGQQPALHWAQATRTGELPGGLRTPEEAAKNGRVPVAVEVIKRMNAISNRDFLLMVGVAGPMTLAARLTHLENNEAVRNAGLPDDARQLAASVVVEMASTFLEAGADLIFIQEEILPVRSTEGIGAWANLLAPVVNIVRFYEAVPVLQLLDVLTICENWDAIFQRQWDCVVSMPLEALVLKRAAGPLSANGAIAGIALPLEAFRPDGRGGESLQQVLPPMISELRPALVTTSGDVPVATDMKHLLRVLVGVPRAV
jgi:hypothetical protein